MIDQREKLIAPLLEEDSSGVELSLPEYFTKLSQAIKDDIDGNKIDSLDFRINDTSSSLTFRILNALAYVNNPQKATLPDDDLRGSLHDVSEITPSNKKYFIERAVNFLADLHTDIHARKQPPLPAGFKKKTEDLIEKLKPAEFERLFNEISILNVIRDALTRALRDSSLIRIASVGEIRFPLVDWFDLAPAEAIARLDELKIGFMTYHAKKASLEKVVQIHFRARAQAHIAAELLTLMLDPVEWQKASPFLDNNRFGQREQYQDVQRLMKEKNIGRITTPDIEMGLVDTSSLLQEKAASRDISLKLKLIPRVLF